MAESTTALPAQNPAEEGRIKVGILYICTGVYKTFWPAFYNSFRQKFLPDCQKQFFVFTDAPALEGENDPAVHKIYQPAWPWPYSSMRRFTIFLQAENELKQMDELFFFNANLVCQQTITSAEFLPRASRGETLLMVQQPGFWDKKPIYFSYERRPKSRAYMPYNCGKWYVSGGLNGGTTAAFLALCHECERRTEQDIAAGIVPIWHDESMLNRYVAEQNPQTVRLLTPAYWYPEGWTMPFEQKILVLQKSKKVDMAAVKGTPRHMGWLARKWQAFCENKLPPLLCLRDTLLGKSVRGPNRHLPGGQNAVQ